MDGTELTGSRLCATVNALRDGRKVVWIGMYIMLCHESSLTMSRYHVSFTRSPS